MKIHKLRLLQPLFLLTFASASASAALIAHYPLEGNVEQAHPGGSTANLTIFGTNPPNWTSGIAPGSSQAVQLGPNTPAEGSGGSAGSRLGAPSAGIWDNVTGFSVSAWVQPQTHPGTGNIFWLGTGASARFAVQVVGQELRVGGRRVAENAFTTVSTTTSPLANLNQTYHVAATADYTTGWVYIYVNGNEVASAELTGWQVGGEYGATASEGTHLFRLGVRGDGQEVFQGLIDDVRIFNHALSASEVAALAIPEPTVPLLGAIGAVGLLRRRRNG